MNISKTIYQVQGGLNRVGDYFDLDRKILIVTDDGVPKEYVDTLIAQCDRAVLYVAGQGEQSKSFATLEEVLNCMMEHNLSREDAVLALGGGIVGDLAGLAAGLYMRGIDWYNIPTTLLAQVDASVGGKTAINMSGIKNIVGMFHQPKGVLIDTKLLSTLPKRQISNGMIEVLKMGFILDKRLVDILEQADYMMLIEELVARSVELKCMVVEQDEKEQSLRRILNYGHTIGHGYESAFLGELLHGEAVACGMLAISEGEVKEKLLKVLANLEMDKRLRAIFDSCGEKKRQEIKDAILHDKKGDKSGCNVVIVEKTGSCEVKKVTMEELFEKVDGTKL